MKHTQLIRRVDGAAQRHRRLGIAVATGQKFIADASPNLAAAMAFWAFFSVFPLLLATVTVLGFVLPEADRTRFLTELSSYLPLLDVADINGLTGSWPALILGLATALWSGTAVMRMTQQGFARIWAVAPEDRPKLGREVLCALATLATVGGGLFVSILSIGFLTAGRELGPASSLLAIAAAVTVDVALFQVAFGLLSPRGVRWRAVVPGAVFSGSCFWVLQTASTLIITQYLADAERTYGSFATVITMLWWFYLQAQVTLLGMVLNVVLARGRRPRPLLAETPTPVGPPQPSPGPG